MSRKRDRHQTDRNDQTIDSEATGIALGHHLAHGANGPFGDPFPIGHAPNAEAIGFWGSLLDAGEDDSDLGVD